MIKKQFHIILLLLYVFACFSKTHAQGSNDTILVIDCELAMAYGMDEYPDSEQLMMYTSNNE